MLSAAIQNISAAIGSTINIEETSTTYASTVTTQHYSNSNDLDNRHISNDCHLRHSHNKHLQQQSNDHSATYYQNNNLSSDDSGAISATVSSIQESNLQQQFIANFATQILNTQNQNDDDVKNGDSGAIYTDSPITTGPLLTGLDGGATNESLFCGPVWDGFYCWPAAPAGVRLERHCLEIFNTVVGLPKHVFAIEATNALAVRDCNQNGTWANDWTNYTECLQVLINKETLLQSDGQSQAIREVVIFILFFCSIVSLILLLVTFFIFTYFKSLACCRLRVHRNLVLALIIHSLLLLILSCPQLFGHLVNWPSYRDIEWLCKSILTLKLYSTLASINWMFIEGLLLHSRITVSIFRKDAPFKLYYFIGWGLPAIVVLIWAIQMTLTLYTECWKGYGDSTYIWIIVGPMITALLINCIFLVNIIRVLVTKLRLMATIELNQIRKAIKATALLFPLLGISHLLFCINPDDNGQFEDAYMIVNAFLQSSQGIFVSVLYCFMDSEVQQVLRNAYHRTKFLKSCIPLKHHHHHHHHHHNNHHHQQQHPQWTLGPCCRGTVQSNGSLCYRCRSINNSQTSISYFANSNVVMMTELTQQQQQQKQQQQQQESNSSVSNNSPSQTQPSLGQIDPETTHPSLSITSVWSQSQFAFCRNSWKKGSIRRQGSNGSIKSYREEPVDCRKQRYLRPCNGHSLDAANSTPDIGLVDPHQHHKLCQNYVNRKLFSFESSSIQSSKSMEIVANRNRSLQSSPNNYHHYHNHHTHHHQHAHNRHTPNTNGTPPLNNNNHNNGDKRRNMCIVYNAKGEMVRFSGTKQESQDSRNSRDRDCTDSPSRIVAMVNQRRLTEKNNQKNQTKKKNSKKLSQITDETFQKVKLKKTFTNKPAVVQQQQQQNGVPGPETNHNHHHQKPINGDTAIY